MRPAAGNGSTRVLLAVIDGCRTYGPLIDRTGLSRSTIAWHLDHLRRLGLVDWIDGRRGTLHPLVEEIPPTSLVTNERSTKVGADNVNGPGAALTAPDRDQHLTRRR